MSKYTSIYGPIHDRARIIWSFLTILPAALIIALSVVLTFAIIAAVGFATGAISDADGFDAFAKSLAEANPALMLAAPFSSFILCTVLWVRLIENRPLSSMGFDAASWAGRYLRGFASGALFLLVVVGVIFIAGGYDVEAINPVAKAPYPASAAIVAAAFLVAFLVQGAAEEVVFRGWWMSALAARRGRLIALLATSIIFALAHMGNVYPPTVQSMVGVANIVLFGLFIGLYALQEGSLWGVCGWHSAWNWLLGLGFGLEVSGGSIGETPFVVDLADTGGAPLLTGGGFGPEASLVTTGVLFAGCGWFVMRGALRGGARRPAETE